MSNTTKNTSLKQNLFNKNVVVDTSSLLVSGVALFNHIENCLLIVPSIVVRELENKRTSNGTIGYMAREWLRLFEELREEFGSELSTGVDYGNNVKIRIQPNHSSQKSLPPHLQDGSADSTILAVAKNAANALKESLDDKTKIAILSNDIPMRLHATLDLDLEAYEFSTTLVEGAIPFTGVVEVEVDDAEYARSSLVVGQESFRVGELSFLPEIEAHATMINMTLESGEKLNPLLKIGDRITALPRRVSTEKIKARTDEQRTALTYLQDPSIPIVSLAGPAGTGKTLLTMSAAIDSATFGETYSKILVFRSLHEMGRGQELGFLPGNMDEKMAPWAQAIYDAIEVIDENSSKHSELKSVISDSLEINPITYLRGRSLHNSFIVLEEAQNFSKSEILNVISRVGDNSKLVMTFDPAQVDNRFLQSGAKAEVWSVINRLKRENLFAHIELTKTERSQVAELAARILSE